MDSPFCFILALIGVAVLFDMSRALKSGVARGRRAEFDRTSSPTAYWIHVAVQGVAGSAMAIGGLVQGLLKL